VLPTRDTDFDENYGGRVESPGGKYVYETESEEESKVPCYRLIGEAFYSYIIVELEDRLLFIDKHAAHERILFEKFKKMGLGESQMMLTPVTVTLSADEYSAIIDNLELLADAGYDIADFGDRTVKVSACPPQLVDENIADVITEIAGYLANNVKTLMPEKLDWIYHSMACRAAIKAGNFTSSYEAEKFVGRVLGDSSIRCCPHGRPVLIELTKKELEKQFKRIV
jgi:DNA mismatch repair protein MutL